MRRTPDLDIIEDPVPLVEMPLAIRLPHSPKRVFLAPNERVLTFDYHNGSAHTRITTSERPCVGGVRNLISRSP